VSFLSRLIGGGSKKKSEEKEKAKKRVAIIGLDSAGKTTIMNRILRSDFQLTKPTFGVNIEVYNYRTLSFIVWDLGGHAPIRKALWNKFVTKAEMIIFVLDAADQARFDLAKKVFYESIASTKPDVPVLFLANKCDKSEAASTINVMKALELENMSRNQEREFNLFRCSALTGEGLFTAFDWLVDTISEEKIPTWHVKIYSAALYDSDGQQIDEVIFGNPTEQAEVAQAFREAIQETERFAKQMKQYDVAVSALEIMKKYQLVINKNQLFVCGLLIDINDPVSRATTVINRIFEAVEMDYLKGKKKDLKEVITNYFPLDTI
jgi:ADP-ribosylation factor-like protein 1